MKKYQVINSNSKSYYETKIENITDDCVIYIDLENKQLWYTIQRNDEPESNFNDILDELGIQLVWCEYMKETPKLRSTLFNFEYK